VLKRAFALGAGEWLLLVLLPANELVAGARSVDAPARTVRAESLVEFLSGSFGTMMLWVCVIGFVASWWMSRRAPAVGTD